MRATAPAKPRATRVQLGAVSEQFGDWGEQVCNYLRERGTRATPGRIAILAALAHSPAGDRASIVPGHLTVPDLIRAVSDLGVALSEPTVYRTVATLQDFDLIHHVAIQGTPPIRPQHPGPPPCGL